MSGTLLLGTRKGLLILARQNHEWRVIREVFPGIPVSYAMCDRRNGMLWACLDHGHWGVKLQRSRDMGESWEEIPAPKYPEGSALPDGAPAATTYLWVVAPGGDDQPGRLYIGTEPGGLFRSDNYGESFQFVESLWNHPSRQHFWFGGGRDHPGLCSIIVDPRDSRHLYAGVSVGGVFESVDGGATWVGRNQGLFADYMPEPNAEYGHDPHLVLGSPANPDVLWQQNHCGIFRSADGARSWEHVSQEDVPAYFGFAIVADERDPDVAWVAPAISAEYRIPVGRALCVSRTDDGGKTWTAYRDGLPQTHCYDIVFRHAMDISGDCLVFGTTSGNVYFSDNRGERWRGAAHNLASVYSARFLDI